MRVASYSGLDGAQEKGAGWALGFMIVDAFVSCILRSVFKAEDAYCLLLFFLCGRDIGARGVGEREF